MAYTLSCSYESHDPHDDDFDFEAAQRRALMNRIARERPKPDKGPLILVTFREDDGEISRLAVSKKEGYMRFPSYDQISKQSDLGRYILEHKSEIKPGWVWERTGAKAIEIDFNFCPNEEPLSDD